MPAATSTARTITAPKVMYKPRWLVGGGGGGAVGRTAEGGAALGICVTLASTIVRTGDEIWFRDGEGGTGVPGRKAGETAVSTMVAPRVLCVTGCATGVTGRTLLKAFRNASADWKRCAGSLAMAIRIISFSAGGSPGCSSTGGFGASFTCAVMMEKSLSA